MPIFHGYFSLLCLAAVALVVIVAQEQEQEQEEECKPVSCPDGPVVRFPFWLEGYQPKRCGYPHPDFQLSCSSDSKTTQLELIRSFNIVSNLNEGSVVLFPITLKYGVLEIDYTLQTVHLSFDDKSFCLPTSPPPRNVSSNIPLPLLGSANDDAYFTVWNCSSYSSPNYVFQNERISCLSVGGHAYKVVAENSFTYNDQITSCEKMYRFYSFEILPFTEDGLRILEWYTPSCAECEKQRMFCRLKKKSNSQTECFRKQIGKGKSRTWVTAGEHFVG